jgi:hypothetical protein
MARPVGRAWTVLVSSAQSGFRVLLRVHSYRHRAFVDAKPMFIETSGSREPALMTQHPPVSVTACPAGPLLVRGDVTVVAQDGSTVPSRRRTIALCRCGASQIQPMCDGSHRIVQQHRAPT